MLCTRGKIRRNLGTKLQFEKPRALLTFSLPPASLPRPSPAFQAFLSLPGVPAGRVGMEQPLAANPAVQQLPPAFQSVTALGPDAKRVLGLNLSLRSPIPCQSSPAAVGAAGTDATRQDAQPLCRISISQTPPPRGLLLFALPSILPLESAWLWEHLLQELALRTSQKGLFPAWCCGSSSSEPQGCLQ